MSFPPAAWGVDVTAERVCVVNLDPKQKPHFLAKERQQEARVSGVSTVALLLWPACVWLLFKGRDIGFYPAFVSDLAHLLRPTH